MKMRNDFDYDKDDYEASQDMYAPTAESTLLDPEVFPDSEEYDEYDDDDEDFDDEYSDDDDDED